MDPAASYQEFHSRPPRTVLLPFESNHPRLVPIPLRCIEYASWPLGPKTPNESTELTVPQDAQKLAMIRNLMEFAIL